jgi:hypothetical protein
MSSFICSTIGFNIFSFLVFSSLGMSTASAETIAEARAALLSCFESHMPSELSKSNPKFKSLRDSYDQEYVAFIVMLRPDIAKEYEYFIKKDTEEELRKRKKNLS